MEFSSFTMLKKYKIEIYLVNLTLLFFIFRTAVPVFKYPFLLLYVWIVGYSILNYKKRIISTLVEFIRNYYLIIILAFILAFAFLSSNKLYLMIFKDFANMLILLSIFFIMTILGFAKKEFEFYVSNLLYLIAFFAVLISILGVLNLQGISSFNDISQISKPSSNIANIQKLIDYNFATIPSFFGIFIMFYLLRRVNSKLQIVTYNILLILFATNIILSGSRRGLFAFIAILILLLIAQVFTLYKKNEFLRKLGSVSKYFLITFSLLALFSLHIVFNTSYAFKIKVLELIGTENIQDTKHKIVYKIRKYTSILGNQSSYQEYYSRIWPTIPEDPDSGWGTRVHKTIFPLKGENVEIVPRGVKGYLMDSTCNGSYYEGIDLSECYTLLETLGVKKGDRCKASVYCFASNDFDGSTLSLGVRNDFVSKGIVFGNTESHYDFQEKGIWQKLEIEFECNDGEVPVYMSFTKKGVKDFSKLKGYLIFAYPQYEKINKSENGSSLNTTQDKSDYTESRLFDLTKTDVYHKYNESLNRLKNTNLVNNSFILSDTVIRANIISSTTAISNKQKFISSGISCFPLSIILIPGSIQNDSDPIRRWASKFISEDTTYYPYKADIVIDTTSNPFVRDRVLRWKFALKIFTKEYNLKQKLFGGGFNFLNWYGYYFYKNKTRSDYPHNPFLSILLYSGILGLIVYMVFMFKVFYYYIKYFKEYKILSVFFIITFFFSFFSAGSPFDPPMMGFFVILPFFIHHIHMKNKPELTSTHINVSK
jgi:hypothetical protein